MAYTRVVQLDRNGKKLRNLSSDPFNAYAFPKTTPRYMPDGRRLMLVAEDYPEQPNDAGRFGANLTVVVDVVNSPIQPYFPVKKTCG